ncbi:hypothetical protein Tdes44962_MAKER04690 [Teratosphaeria destructans]|uniref:Uncharacterized protein n=1 Tax=Teratosphaeria destructans TaxID=418781 RepID=A0A9W7SLI9_9PEZI|nr:hypothetical protein Tdes44962_MAKER04690 [Teratosphaeria destructans]
MSSREFCDIAASINRRLLDYIELLHSRSVTDSATLPSNLRIEQASLDGEIGKDHSPEEREDDVPDVLESAVEQPVGDREQNATVESQLDVDRPDKGSPAGLRPISQKHRLAKKPPMIPASGMPTPPQSASASALSSARQSQLPPKQASPSTEVKAARPDSPTLADGVPEPADSHTRPGDKTASVDSEAGTAHLENVYAGSEAAAAIPKYSRYRPRTLPEHTPAKPSSTATHMRNFSLPLSTAPTLWQRHHSHYHSCCERPSCYHKRMTWLLSSSRFDERMAEFWQLFREIEAVILAWGATSTERPQIVKGLDIAAHALLNQAQEVERECRVVKHGVAMPMQSTARAIEAMEKLIFDGLIHSLQELERSSKRAEDMLMTIEPWRSRILTAGHTRAVRFERSTGLLSSRPNPSNELRQAPMNRTPGSMPAQNARQAAVRLQRSLPALNTRVTTETPGESNDKPHQQDDKPRLQVSFMDIDDDDGDDKPKKSVKSKASLFSLKQRFWSKGEGEEKALRGNVFKS